MQCTAPVRSTVRVFASLMVMFAITAGLASAAEQRVQEVNYSSVEVHGIKVFYREAGPAEGPPILLSNPTSRAEARPEDLIAWTDGRALVATGSPFGDVSYQGRRIRTAQCNNSYIFPAMGLGILSVRARRVTESMFMVAAQALAECSPALSDPQGALLPPLEDIRGVSRRVALAVAAEAQRQGVAERAPAEASERLVDAKMWTPHYSRLRRRAG